MGPEMSLADDPFRRFPATIVFLNLTVRMQPLAQEVVLFERPPVPELPIVLLPKMVLLVTTRVGLPPRMAMFVTMASAAVLPLPTARFWIPAKLPLPVLPEMVLLLTVRYAGTEGVGDDCSSTSLSIPPAVLLRIVLFLTVGEAP